MRQKERSERNIRIALMRIRQVPVKDIAEIMDLGERQDRRIMADWREGALRAETERSAETAMLILENIRDDMKALNISAASETPEGQIAIHDMKMERLQKSTQILLDLGVSFEGLFEGPPNDLELIADVNAAIRKTLVGYGVDQEAIEASMDASLEAFAGFGYGPGAEADISYSPEEGRT